MGLFSRLFASRKPAETASTSSTQTTTAQNPFQIDTPVIGFVNIHGTSGEEAMKADQQILKPLFNKVSESRCDVPQCSVLFLYCDVDAAGKIVGRNDGIRDIIKAAGAYVAVVASENSLDHYMECLGPHNDWSANIILTIDRKDDKFAKFFAELFRQMYTGKSMLMAWAELVPQIPDYDHPDAPGTIMAAEAGHLIFRSSGITPGHG